MHAATSETIATYQHFLSLILLLHCLILGVRHDDPVAGGPPAGIPGGSAPGENGAGMSDDAALAFEQFGSFGMPGSVGDNEVHPLFFSFFLITRSD